MSNVISNVSIANLTSTWTEDTRVYTGLGLSVTATNYDPASKVFKLMVNGNTIFSVDAAGTLTAPAISVANAIVDISAPFNKANAAYLVANSAANNTNAVYDVVNVVYTVTNSSYTVTNASFGVANASFGFANGLTTIITASFSKANVAYDLAVASFNSSNNVHNSANAAGVIANAAFNKANNVVISVDFSPVFNTANAAFDKANSGYTLAASAYDLAFYAGTATNTTAAFAKANAANSLAHETGIAANNYAGAMANAANGFASSIVAANLITARAYTNSATISANNYAGFMANSGNLYTESIVASNLTTARAYTNSATVAANNYAGAMANAVNVSLTSSITTLRQYVNTSTVAANAYSGFMSNAVNSYTVATYSTITFTEAAFDKANDAYSLVQILSGNSSANIANLQNNLSLINAVYDVTNAAFNKANSANVFAFNTDIKTIAAFEKANTLEISANAYAGVMANSSNGYAGVMANSANGYAESIVASNLTTARAYTNSATISANNRAGVMVNSANGYAESIVASNLVTSRAYTNSATISANVYAGVMSNSSNGYAESIVAANLVISREYTNTSTAAANNRAGFMANSANAIAASIVAANLITARAYTNSATVAANNYAGVMANAANANIESTVAAARLYVNTSTEAANNYSGFMANSANGIAATIVAANLVIAREYTNVSVIASNNYAGVMANSVNGAFATADSGVRGYVNTSVIAANNYSGFMANSGNSWASATFATITTVAFNATSANNYAGVMANSSNGYAAATYATQSLVSTGLTSANNYSGFMANSGNSWVSATFATQTTLATGLTSANNYAGAMANAANAYALSLGGGASVISANNYAGVMANAANAYAATVGISANNYAGVMANSANAYASSLSPDLTAANNYAGAMANSANGYAGVMANAANGIAASIVAANLVTSRAYTNTSTAASNNYAGVMANSANGIAASIVASNLVISRDYTNTSTTAANNYSGFMSNSANGYAESIVASNLVTSRAYTNTSTTAANNYAGVMANASNSIASTIVAANLTTARSYTDTSTTAANNRAGFMANSANGYAESIVASNLVTSRAYTNTSTTAANNYAGVMANSANSRADTKVATVTGSSGRITSTGGTTPVIDLASGVIADTNPRTGGISSITVDTYGRVTSVTGSAGYTTGSGYLPLSGGTMTGTLTLAGQVWSGNITWNNNINIGISGESSFDVGTGGQWGVWDTGSSNFWMRTNYNDHLRLVENGKNVYVYGGRLYTDTSQTYIHSGSIGSYATTGVAAGTGLTGGGTTGSLTLALSTVGAGQATYSSGISAITVDAYGRVTGVTGSANYLPLSGGTLTGRVIQSASGFGVAYDDTINNRVDSGFWETAYATTANGWPETTSTWYHLLASTHSNLSNYFSMQFAGSFFDSNALYYRATNGSGTTAWNKIWHAGNDGAASGLDADLLDGQQGSYYLNVGNMNAGTLAVIRGGTGVSTSTGSGSVVLSNSPTLVTPILGTPTSGNLSNCTFPTLNQNTTGSAGSVTATVTGTTGTNLVSGFMADNDSCRIRIGADATDAGWLEIATADNGTEPIYFRQYTGAFATVTRTLTLLDGSGNTTIPGNLTLSPANPTITSGSSYITIPNGLYVSGGTPYFQNQIQARGGIYNDTGVTLTLAGGTGGYTTVTGSCRSPIFYKSDDVAVRWTGNDFVLRGISPTIYLRDNDGSSNSAMIHVNGNTFYVLRGTGDTETWSQVNGQWPLVINLNTNGMTAGGTLNTVGNITAPNVYASRYYDNDDAAYYIDPAATSIVNQVNYALLSGQNVNTRDKVRVWSSSSYTIGMTSPFTFGAIANDYAMTFQMNNASTRGFWWGDEVHTSAQGAMSLSTDGKLTVAHSIRAGYGEGDTTVPGATYRLDISGIGHASTDFRAPSFVDSITTAYYLDPAGASNLNSATFAGTVSVPSGFTVRKQDNANEGGEFYVEKATNSTLAGNIIIDNITNSLRIFEGASPFRGVTLDISACGSPSTLIHSGNINSFVSRIRMQSMTISVINTFPALTSTYSGQMFMLIVNGTCFTPADSPSPFSVSGTTITWNGASVWSVNPGDVVTAIYSY